MKYNMKKIVIIIAALAITINASAQQTLADGIKMYNYKKYQTAQNILAPLAATDAQANYYLGLVYLATGDVSKATNTFVKYPDDMANISGTARVAYTNKDVAKGNQITKDLAAKSKKKEWMSEKYAADAITYTTGGDYHQAITWYTDALTKTDDASVHIAMGDAYRKIPGGGGDAMTNYEHVTEKDPKNSLAYSRIGDLWYEARNSASAVENYNKSKDADNTNPLPFKALAYAYELNGKYDMALQNVQQYLTLSDNTPDDKKEMAEALFQAKKYCDAVKSAKDLMSQPSSEEVKTELYGILGFSQAECGDSLEAIKNVRIWLIRQDPKKIFPNDYVNVGRLFLKADMLDSAVFYYKKGIAGDTAQNKTDIYRQIAEAFKTKKDYCNSADWYNNLVKANPGTQPLDYFWRGYMYYYCGDKAKTVSAFEEYQNKYPDQPSAIYWHARGLAAIDSEANEGTAVPFFNKWLETVGPNYDKKNDMKIAYEYLLLYSYNKKDKDNTKQYEEKVRAIDPNNALAKQIDDAEKAGTPRKTPTKPKAK